MKDITETVRQAMNQDVLWSISVFDDFLDDLKAKFDVSFWMNDESWATVSIDKTLIGYIWSKYPLVFVHDRYFGEVSMLKQEYPYIEILEVDDMASNLFAIDHVVLKDFMNFNIDYTSFSATDLWFATNSQ